MPRLPAPAIRIFCWTWIAAGPWVRPCAADEDFFERRVRPVLMERCYECHSEENAESDLRVDSRAALIRGGARGAAIVPGDPEKSLLMLAVTHRDQLQMPPKAKISQGQIADLAQWIRQGAVWPDSPPADTTNGGGANGREISPEEASFWAFQPPRAAPLPVSPATATWETWLDAYLDAARREAGLQAAPPASPATWLRRVTLDLTGLAPAPVDQATFAADTAPDAAERCLDRLLASPRYGERWGRKWLDVARYADSNGLDENLAYAHAFHYRDYVVTAFNHDKPYDQFVREQLAGDLLADPSLGSERLTATGFLCLGAKMLAEDDPVKMQMDIVDEQVDTIGQVFLGLTLGCARCHDHKFDPLRTEDYYALAGILKSTRTMENFSVVARWQERPIGTDAELARHRQETEQLAERRRTMDELTQAANQRLVQQARPHAARYLAAAVAQLALDHLQTRLFESATESPEATGPGARVWEAEDFVRGNVRKDREHYGQGIGVLVNQGPTPNFVEYDLPLLPAGWYRLDLRYAAAQPRPCQLYWNGMLRRSEIAGKVTGAWTPEAQQWFMEDLCWLPEGAPTLRLEQAAAFPHIDKFRLTPVNAELAKRLADLAPSDETAANPLVGEFVEAWKKRLQQELELQEREAPDPLLAPWLAWLRQLQTGESPPAAAAAVESLPLQLGLPLSRAGLVAAYEQWSQRVLAEKAEGPPEGPPEGAAPPAGSTDLAEPSDRETRHPQDERWRALLLAENGPFAPSGKLEAHYEPEQRARLAALRTEIAEREKDRLVLPEVMAVSEGSAEPIRVHIRGSHLTLGAEVPRGVPQVFFPGRRPPGWDQAKSGRLELARWLTSPDNPLTARVFVNRVWLGHFGEGLVRSPDNFGKLGERPTHPELLDTLAVRFVESGWQVKRLHREMLLSGTYRQSTAWNASAAEQDPDNRLYWRAHRRRLDAEEIRDQLLDLGEGLDLRMGGSLLTTANRAYVTSTANVNPVVYETRRRSIYLPVVRSALYDVFQAFDFPDPSTLHGKRESTTIAPQALFMMNSSLVQRQTRALAERLCAEYAAPEERVREAFQSVLCRGPVEEELQQSLAYVAGERAAALEELAAWQSLCRVLVSSNEFMYVD